MTFVTFYSEPQGEVVNDKTKVGVFEYWQPQHTSILCSLYRWDIRTRL